MAIRRKWIMLFTMLIATLALMLFSPTRVLADTDIKVRICDPDRINDEEDAQEGNTINQVLSAPAVSYGENRELGSVQITGKAGIAVPLSEGQKIMVILPWGTSYMQVPDESSYRNYVEWPEQFEGKKNQVCDSANKPGISFIAATPRSLTVELSHVDSSGDIMVINFLFNQEDFSKTRIASFVEIAEEYLEYWEGEISRREFFTHIARLVGPFSASPLKSINGNIVAADLFADISEEQADIDRILPLIEGGLVKGYAGGFLQPEQSISRAEAAHLAGMLFGVAVSEPAPFKDSLPEWAQKGINKAYAARIIQGYPDGSFQAGQHLSKAEAIIILQNCLERYSKLPLLN